MMTFFFTTALVQFLGRKESECEQSKREASSEKFWILNLILLGTSVIGLLLSTLDGLLPAIFPHWSSVETLFTRKNLKIFLERVMKERNQVYVWVSAFQIFLQGVQTIAYTLNYQTVLTCSLESPGVGDNWRNRLLMFLVMFLSWTLLLASIVIFYRTYREASGWVQKMIPSPT
jgi:hypothetical protein